MQHRETVASGGARGLRFVKYFDFIPFKSNISSIEKAMQIVEGELRDALDGYVKSWMPARAIVKEAIEERKKHDPEGRLLKFPKGGLPWKSHLFEMEKGNGSLFISP